MSGPRLSGEADCRPPEQRRERGPESRARELGQAPRLGEIRLRLACVRCHDRAEKLRGPPFIGFAYGEVHIEEFVFEVERGSGGAISLPHLTPTNQAQSHRTLGAQLSAARLFPGWDAARHPQAASEAHRHLVGRARAVPGGRALLAELPLPGRTVVTAGPASVLVLLPTATRRRACCHRVSPVYPGRFGPRAPPYSTRTYEIRSCR